MKLYSRLTLFAALAVPVSLTAATISGTVTNGTTNKPAAGDTAVLLDLQQSMTESARTKIDAQGHFSFSVPDNAGMHLVRVDHDKASYYGPVPPNTTTVNIDVFDVAPKVQGVHVYADVARMETDQQGLKVTESYFIRNESKPPRTQLSEHSFEIYLPKDAMLEGATAAGPGGMAISSSPVPMGDKGHYAFVFPLRPGESRFQVGYRLPYNGSLVLHARTSLPTDNVAIMLPKSMTFNGGNLFQPLQGDANEPGEQTYLTTNVAPGKDVSYTVSGTGSLPREAQNGPQGQQGGMGGPGGPGSDQQVTPANGPGGGLGVPIDTPDPLQKYKWWILSGVGLALVIAAAFTMRAKQGAQPAAAGAAPAPSPLTPTLPPGVKATAYRAATLGAAHTGAPAPHAPAPPAPAAAQTGGTMLTALKEELLALEMERLEGKISESDYTEQKAALDKMMRRALARETITR